MPQPTRPASPPRISIIVPLAADDESWRELLPQLPPDWDVCIAAATPPPADWQQNFHLPNHATQQNHNARPNRTWQQCTTHGRGAQMNEAAQHCEGDFLWFVHADCRVPLTAAAKLQKAVCKNPNHIYYFDLHFYDGGWRMRINELGVIFRCLFFANPFGDQALCVPRNVFESLGGYSNITFGEDHVFVLRARRAGCTARRVGVAISTSARTYIQHGWRNTMRRYRKIWWQQWREHRTAD